MKDAAQLLAIAGAVFQKMGNSTLFLVSWISQRAFGICPSLKITQIIHSFYPVQHWTIQIFGHANGVEKSAGHLCAALRINLSFHRRTLKDSCSASWMTCACSKELRIFKLCFLFWTRSLNEPCANLRLHPRKSHLLAV